MEAVSVIGIAIVIAVIIMMVKGIKIVPQAHAYVIERLGKYNATLEGGFHIIIPIIDSVAMMVTKQEQIIDIPQQSVITKDNVLESLIAALEATPVAIRDSNDLKVVVSADVFQAYNFYLVSQGVINGLGGADMPVTFAGYTMERVSGLAPSTIVIYERDNLIFGTGLLGDHNELRVRDMDDSLMDGNVRMKMVYNAGVQYYNSAEIVYFVSNVAP